MEVPLDAVKRFGWLVFGTYLGISWLVKDYFPFSRFDMFAQAQQSTSELAVLDGSGREVPLHTLTAFECVALDQLFPRFENKKDRHSYTTYRTHEFKDYVMSHSLSPDSSVAAISDPGRRPDVDLYRIVRKIWRIDAAAGRLNESRSEITTCRARRKAFDPRERTGR